MSQRNFMVDIESLDVCSSAVVLSVAVIQFDLGEVADYGALLDRALFVKLDVAEQVSRFKSTMSRDTIEWWTKQTQTVRLKSFTPNKEEDLSPEDALANIRAYCDLSEKSNDNHGVTFWARGCLDQVCLDNLSRKVSGDLLIPYNNWYDVRTAIDLTCDGARRGYVTVPGFDHFARVHKHDPIHDCANDLMMLLSNNQETV